jgi:polyhydroxybutyrate depolymerase
MFPARMFTLPVTTRALAGWPMLFGAAAMASLWLVTAPLVRWSWGLELPLVWPALLGAAFLAWTQVLTWTAYGLPGLRIAFTVLWLASLDAMVILAVQLEVPEPWLVAMLAPQLPLAFLAACVVVARARRGDVPDWRPAFTRIGRLAYQAVPGPERFASPTRAQAWFEWRQHGRVLPALVSLLLPFELGLLYLASDEPAVLVFLTLAGVALTPPVMAGFVAATALGTPRGGSDASGATLTATRPLSSAALVAARLRAALRSALVTWLLVLAVLPLALGLTGTWPVVLERTTNAIATIGMPRALALALLGLAGLVASTFKQLVQGLFIGLSGHLWLGRASVLVRLALLVALWPIADWAHSQPKRAFAAAWEGGLFVLVALACLKLGAAAWVAGRVHRARLLSDRRLVTAAAAWLSVVLALYGVLVWLVSSPPFIPRYLPALVALLAVPLVRVAAAPLALDRGRHRGAARPPDPAPGAEAKQSTRALVAAWVLLGLPLALVAAELAWFEVRNRNNGMLVSSGQLREYRLHVPRSYDSRRPTPLVVSLHGGGGWPAMQEEASQWSRLAEREGFIVAYPSGLGSQPRAWRAFRSDAGLAEDVRYIADLIDALQAAYNIDASRIYADGLSNGGGMTFVLSCALSERIAAVGMVAAAHMLPFEWCEERRPVPMIAFHGTADSFAPYHGGRSFVVDDGSLQDIPAFTAAWARRNGCRPESVASTAAPRVARLEYAGCGADAAVVLYSVEGGGHSWPGGGPLPEWFVGPTSRSVDATRLMWEFFRAHPLRAGSRD